MDNLWKNQKFILVLMIAAIGLVYPYALPARGAEFPKTAFEKDKHFIICSGSGYAYISKKTSRGKGQQKAMAAAKRLLLRKSSQILKSRLAGMKNNVRFEFVELPSGEYIRVLEQKKIEPPIRGTGSAYGIQIIAEIQYRLIFSGNRLKILSNPRLPLTVRVWSDKQEYRAGERVVFYIKGNRDFYTRIIDVAPSGEMIQLLPNTYRKFRFFEGGKTYYLPDANMGDNFQLNVSPPFGEESVFVLASDAPIGQASFAEYVGAFARVRGSEAEIARGARQEVVSKIKSEAGTFSYVEFFEGQWSIRTRKK